MNPIKCPASVDCIGMDCKYHARCKSSMDRLDYVTTRDLVERIKENIKNDRNAKEETARIDHWFENYLWKTL